MKYFYKFIFFVFSIFCFSAAHAAEAKREAQEQTVQQESDIMSDDMGERTLREKLNKIYKQEYAKITKCMGLVQEELVRILGIAIKQNKTAFILYLKKTYPQLAPQFQSSAFEGQATEAPDIMSDDMGEKTLQAELIRNNKEQDYKKIKNCMQEVEDKISIMLTLAINEKSTPFALYLMKTYPRLVLHSPNYLPLQLAIGHDNLQIVQYIIKHFPQAINAKDINGDYPIFEAITQSSFELLLENGARVDVLNQKNNTITYNMIEKAGTDSYPLLQILFQSPQVKNNDQVREFLLNTPSGVTNRTPLCRVAHYIEYWTNVLKDKKKAQSWTPIAKILIDNGAECHDSQYREILAPLMKEKLGIIHQTLGTKEKPEPLLPPIVDIVGQFFTGEQTPKEPTSSTAGEKSKK